MMHVFFRFGGDESHAGRVRYGTALHELSSVALSCAVVTARRTWCGSTRCSYAGCAMHRSGSMVLFGRVAGNAMETWTLLSFSSVSRY
jgi:hypothetical protein